jgi:hypothetical protein
MRLCSKKIFSLILNFVLVVGVFMAAGKAWGDPPPWAPAHGYRYKHHHNSHAVYKYYYYPAQQVYYSLDRRGYYYLNNGVWLFAPQLPTRINLGRYVSVDLGTPLPYTQHTTIIQSYPVIVGD